MKPDTERNARIVALWRSTDLTFTELGERLGVSRNVVSGVLHRAGCTDPNAPSAHRTKRNNKYVGSANPRSKLTEFDVIRIREARTNGVLLKTLAKEYGVHISSISRAAIGLRGWAHVQ